MSHKVQHITQADFEHAVLKSQTPMLVDFYADWCGPCRMVGPVMETLSQEYTGRVSFAKVDTDANQSLAMRYNIMSIPTVMIFKGGQIVGKVIGAVPAEAYRRKIEAALGAS